MMIHQQDDDDDIHSITTTSQQQQSENGMIEQQQQQKMEKHSKRLARVFLSDEFDSAGDGQPQRQSIDISINNNDCNTNIYTEPTIVNNNNNTVIKHSNSETAAAATDSLTIVGQDVAITLRQGQLTQTLLNGQNNRIQPNKCFVPNQQQQQVILMTNRMEFLPLCDLLFNIISLAAYFCDIVFDLVTAYTLYLNRQTQWLLVTMFLIILTLIISQLLSYRWWCNNQQQNCKSNESNRLILMVHLLQCGVLWRYFKLFTPVNIFIVKREVSELCMLRMIHAFIEAGPMLLLQTYLLWRKQSNTNYTITDLNIISILLSLFTICWALSSFNKNIRPNQIHRLVLTWFGVIFQFFWRVGTITSRIVAITVYAVLYKQWVFVVIFLHWFSMLLWLLTPHCLQHLDQQQHNNNHKIKNLSMKKLMKKLFIASSIAWIYVFCFVNMEDNHSRYRMLTYYLMMFTENLLLLSISIIFDNRLSTIDLYRWLAICFVIISFIIGLMFMYIYYRYFHIKNLTTTKQQQKDVTTVTKIYNNQHHQQQLLCSNRIEQINQVMNESLNKNSIIDPKLLPLTIPYNNNNNNNQPISTNDNIPGVFSCRLNTSSALKRKKKKPSTIPPLPMVSIVSNYSDGGNLNQNLNLNNQLDSWKPGLNSKNLIQQQQQQQIQQRPFTNSNIMMEHNSYRQQSSSVISDNNQRRSIQQRSWSISPTTMMKSDDLTTIKFTDHVINHQIQRPKPIVQHYSINIDSISEMMMDDRQQTTENQQQQEIYFNMFNQQQPRPPVPGRESRNRIKDIVDNDDDLNSKKSCTTTTTTTTNKSSKHHHCKHYYRHSSSRKKHYSNKRRINKLTIKTTCESSDDDHNQSIISSSGDDGDIDESDFNHHNNVNNNNNNEYGQINNLFKETNNNELRKFYDNVNNLNNNRSILNNNNNNRKQHITPL